jgi:hypothetical protein
MTCCPISLSWSRCCWRCRGPREDGVPWPCRVLTAALYAERANVTAGDQDVRARAVLVLAVAGQQVIRWLAARISELEESGTLDDAEWLAWCRQRVAGMTVCCHPPVSGQHPESPQGRPAGCGATPGTEGDGKG